MKKLSLILLAFLFIGLGNVVAQTEATAEVKTEEVKKDCPFTKTDDGKLICTKTGKICSDACKNKANGSCCKGGNKKKCSGKKGTYNRASKNYSSRSNSGFNFNKKSSCSKAVKKCGEGCAKACCAKEESTDEGDDSDDDNGSEE